MDGQAEENRNFLTMSERLELIIDEIMDRMNMDRMKGQHQNGFLSKKEFCTICGCMRFDQDATGLTCGNERCLKAFEDYLKGLEADSQALKGLIKTAGLSEDSGDAVLKIEGILEDKWQAKETIIEIAKLLGIDTEQSIEELCEKITTEIEEISVVVARAQQIKL